MGDIYNNHSKKITQEEMDYIASFINDKIKCSTGLDIHYLSYGPPKERRRDGPRNVICHLCNVENMITAADLEAHLNGEVHRTNLQRDICKNAVVRMYQYVYAYEKDKPVFFRIKPGENIPHLLGKWAGRFDKADPKKPAALKKLPEYHGDIYRANNQSRTITQEEMDYIGSLINEQVTCRTGLDIHYLSYGPPKERRRDGPRNIICHICKVDNMVTAADLEAHLNGEVHRTNLQRDVCKKGVVKYYEYVYEYENDKPVFFRILPGENIRYLSGRWASRFEKDDPQKPVALKKLPEHIVTSDPAIHFSVRYPLLGLDYILNVNNPGDHLIFCVLCDRFFEKSVYEHVSDFDHEHKYIVKHFPNLLQKAKTLLKIPDESAKQRLIHHIFRQIYGRITKKRGRKKIYACPRKEITRRTQRYKDQTLERITPFDENTLDYARMAERLEALVNECHENGNNLGFYPPNLPDLIGDGTPYEVEKEIFWKEVAKIEEAYKLHTSNRTPYGNAKQKELTELESKYKKYDDLPESHPDYKNEWKTYYIKTCERLRKDGVRIEDYDFEKDWFPHWDKCKEEAFRKEWDSIRDSLKKSFNIPLHAKSPDFFSDNEDSDSEFDSDWTPEREIIKPEKPVDLLAVLRILSALENYLGSLGPKCMELLGEAIIKEKHNQLNELLLQNDNLIYFATVNEKLKGLLATKSIAAEVVQKVEKLIEDIKGLIDIMEMYEMDKDERYSFRKKDREPAAANNKQINSFDSNLQESNDICKNPFRKDVNFQSLGSIMAKKQPKGKKQPKAKKYFMPKKLKKLNIDVNSTDMSFPDVEQTVNIGSRSQFESYQENNAEQQDFHASNSQHFRAPNLQQNFQHVATGINQQQDYRQSSENCSNWSDPKSDGQAYFVSTDFDDHFKGTTVQNYVSEGWGQNCPKIDYQDQNYDISIAERRDSRDPKAELHRYPEPLNFQAQRDSKAEIRNYPESSNYRDPHFQNERYHEPSNFEPKREPSISRNGSETRYRSYERGTSDAEFRRERPDYQRFRELSRREDRNYRERPAYRNERYASRRRSRSRSRGYNNGNVTSRHNSRHSYGNSRESRRR